MQDLRHIKDVVNDHVHVIDSFGSEHMRGIMNSLPQLRIDMMVGYLSTAYSRELDEKAGGVSPALWAKQLQLAMPVLLDFLICSLYA